MGCPSPGDRPSDDSNTARERQGISPSCTHDNLHFYQRERLRSGVGHTATTVRLGRHRVSQGHGHGGRYSASADPGRTQEALSTSPPGCPHRLHLLRAHRPGELDPQRSHTGICRPDCHGLLPPTGAPPTPHLSRDPRPCPALPGGVCPESSALTLSVLQQLLWDSSRLDRGLLPESVGRPRPPARPEPRNQSPPREGCVYFTLHTFFQHKEAPALAALWALAGTFQQPRVPCQPSYLLRGEAGPLPPSGVSCAWHLIFRTVF